MDHSDQDRLVPESSPADKPSLQWLPLTIVIGLALLLSAGAYYLYSQQASKQTEAAPEASVNNDILGQAEVPSSPNIVEPETSIPLRQNETIHLSALPSLGDPDDFLRKHWSQWRLPTSTNAWIQGDFIIQRGVSFIDGLANGALLRKLTPLDRSAALLPTGSLKVAKVNDELWLDEANFDRYGKFITFLEAIEPNKLAGVFHWLRPPLESAYGELGQPEQDFGNRLITGLNLLLKTPDIDTPIKLKRDSVFYQFADPALEALPDSQKLLLRVGAKNRAIIKQWLLSLKHSLMMEAPIPAPVNQASGE